MIKPHGPCGAIYIKLRDIAVIIFSSGYHTLQRPQDKWKYIRGKYPGKR